ncbi:TNF receptor-associated factor 3-like isoform X2 [Clytia hemisphaerica]|uniref:TNF receptor-associated factor 3-like isoform X2 n=1 Tax=Clytia hemisphaerica TaxID=252671 RepID=UPI0034D72BD0
MASRSNRRGINKKKNFVKNPIHSDVEIIDTKLDSESQICIICNLLMRNPVQGIPLVEDGESCGHRFCKACLERWHKECKYPECPTCRQLIKAFPDAAVERKILDLKIKCTNYIKGCKQNMELRDLEMEDHVKNICKERLKDCQFKNIGCTFKGNPSSLKDHALQATNKHLTLAIQSRDQISANQEKKIEVLQQELETSKKQIKELKCSNNEKLKTLENDLCNQIKLMDEGTMSDIGVLHDVNKHLSLSIQSRDLSSANQNKKIESLQQELKAVKKSNRDLETKMTESKFINENQLKKFNNDNKLGFMVEDLNAKTDKLEDGMDTNSQRSQFEIKIIKKLMKTQNNSVDSLEERMEQQEKTSRHLSGKLDRDKQEFAREQERINTELRWKQKEINQLRDELTSSRMFIKLNALFVFLLFCFIVWVYKESLDAVNVYNQSVSQSKNQILQYIDNLLSDRSKLPEPKDSKNPRDSFDQRFGAFFALIVMLFFSIISVLFAIILAPFYLLFLALMELKKYIMEYVYQ